MRKHIYSGPDTRFGRFGVIRRGDILMLTKREAEQAKAVEFLHPLKNKSLPGRRPLPRPNDSPDEEARKLWIENQNQATPEMEFQGLTKWEIWSEIEKLKQSGVQINVQFGEGRQTLVNILRDHVLRAKEPVHTG